jgi:putative oxidoreductase
MPMLTTNLVSVAHGLIGFYFVFFGVWNIYHWTRIISTMINKRIPHPYLLLPIGIGWQTIAGAMIMCSMLPKIAALSLIPFSIASVCIFHSFWNFKGEQNI